MKIAVVIQRYGLEITGGAELQCRLFAEHLLTRYPEIHILTTKAKDHMTWKNEYSADDEQIHGVHVHRFKVEKGRDRRFAGYNTAFINEGMPPAREEEWLIRQGPYAPGLIAHIREKKDDYDVFLFFTYLYHPTVFGIREVYEKSILVPEAHDEPYIRMQCMKDVFEKPAARFFNTHAERRFVESLFSLNGTGDDIGGIGIDIPGNVDGERFKKKYGVDRYILYAGRIEAAKNCGELFSYFLEYKKRNHTDLKLVLMGKEAENFVPKDENIIRLGFVSDEDKYDGMAGATVFVLPSKFESLSMVVLESMAVETPVLVNSFCEVLVDHCIKSNGALYYRNYSEFEGELNYLLTHPKEVAILKANAKEYVDRNYRWDVLIDRLSDMIERVYVRSGHR